MKSKAGKFTTSIVVLVVVVIMILLLTHLISSRVLIDKQGELTYLNTVSTVGSGNDFTVKTQDGNINGHYGMLSSIVANGKERDLRYFDNEPYPTLMEKHKINARYIKKMISSTIFITASEDVSFFFKDDFMSTTSCTAKIAVDGTVDTTMILHSPYMSKILDTDRDVYVFIPAKQPAIIDGESRDSIEATIILGIVTATKTGDTYDTSEDHTSFKEDIKARFMAHNSIISQLTIHRTSNTTATLSYTSKSVNDNTYIKDLLNNPHTFKHIFANSSIK